LKIQGFARLVDNVESVDKSKPIFRNTYNKAKEKRKHLKKLSTKHENNIHRKAARF